MDQLLTFIMDNNPLTYILTTAKLDAANHHRVASLAAYILQLYYRVGKANVNADALSWVSWPICVPNASCTKNQITAAAVQAMQEATLEGLASPTEVYSCDLHVMDPVEDSLKVACMTTKDWQQTQLADPVLGQVITKM